MASSWDERYAGPGYYYGEAPNDFLRERVQLIPPGPVLCIGEGEGRNAIFLAQQGFAVTAVDLSEVGLAKLRERAAAQGLAVRTVRADLAGVDFGSACWSAIVSVFCHLPPPLRVFVHRRLCSALAPGGVLLLEGYTPRQLGYATGGPRERALLYEPADLAHEFAALRRDRVAETERDVIEGVGHTGRAAVVQVVAFRD